MRVFALPNNPNFPSLEKRGRGDSPVVKVSWPTKSPLIPLFQRGKLLNFSPTSGFAPCARHRSMRVSPEHSPEIACKIHWCVCRRPDLFARRFPSQPSRTNPSTPLADKHLVNTRLAPRFISDSCQRDSGIGDPVLFTRQQHRHADDGKIAVSSSELHKRATGLGRSFRD